MSSSRMSSELVPVLQTAYQALKEEVDRIQRLLNAPPEGLRKLASLDEKDGTLLATKFGPFLTDAQNLLGQIENAIGHNDHVRGWKLYVELRTEKMPVLTSELLSVIGGAFVQEQKLDPISSVDAGQSFSDRATE